MLFFMGMQKKSMNSEIGLINILNHRHNLPKEGQVKKRERHSDGTMTQQKNISLKCTKFHVSLRSTV